MRRWLLLPSRLMRVAVLGLGFMGSTHLKAMKAVPDAEVAAVYSSDELKLTGDLSGIQGNIGGPGEKLDFANVRKYRDLSLVLADPDIEAVDICLPTHLHSQTAIHALRAGKHVLVEKPMALDAASAREVIEEARKSGRILMAAQVLRFFPMYEAVRELRDTGRLGAVRSALFRRRCAAPAWSKWLGDPAQSGGGVFDLLIHDIDMALHLFGKPSRVAATGCSELTRGIDVITAVLDYGGKFAVTVTGGWHHPKSYPFSMEYTVVGENGTADYASGSREPTFYRANGEAEPLPQAPKDGYAAEIEYFIACAQQGRSPELCPPEESADSVALARLLLDARDRNGEWISCQF